MRHVVLDATIGAQRVDGVFDAVLRWELPDPERGSSWEWEADSSEPAPVITSGVRPRWLEFRSGMLRWNEEINGYPDDLEIRFALTDGDFETFVGKWTFHQESDDVALRFEVDYSFGIESMAGILDPIAEQAIKDTIGRAVLGMFPTVKIHEHPRGAVACE